MKKETEKQLELSLSYLLMVLNRNIEDLGTVLDAYERTHDDREREESKQYAGAVAGYFGIKETYEAIAREINRNQGKEDN